MDLLRESYFDQSQLTDEVLEGYQAPLKVKGWEVGFWNFATAPRANDLADNLSDLNMPTLLVTGSNDTVVPTSDTVKLETLIPNSVVEIIQDSAHLPQEEKPFEFIAAISKNWSGLVSK
jgi:pimeloyl-ACP methyl ester carboxylesterase